MPIRPRRLIRGPGPALSVRSLTAGILEIRSPRCAIRLASAARWRPANERAEAAPGPTRPGRRGGPRPRRRGLVAGTSGNVSEREGELVAITPTGAVLAELERRPGPVVDLGGELVGGELAPTSELDLHLGVYRRYDAGAVVHTHAPVATALSCVLDELPCVHYEMLRFGGAVRGRPLPHLRHARARRDRRRRARGPTAALMANHGTIAFGADVERAATS